MKKKWTSAAILFCGVALLSMPAAASDTEMAGEAFSENGSVEVCMANPFTDCKTLYEAEGLAGFGMNMPQLPEGYTAREFRVIPDEMIEVICRDKETHAITVRKGLREAQGDDISGDYNDYSDVIEDYDVHLPLGTRATFKGEGGRYSLAVWAERDYAYSISTEESLAPDTLAKMCRAMSPNLYSAEEWDEKDEGTYFDGKLREQEVNTLDLGIPDRKTQQLLNMVSSMSDNCFYTWKTDGSFSEMLLRLTVYRDGQVVERTEYDPIPLENTGEEEQGFFSVSSDLQYIAVNFNDIEGFGPSFGQYCYFDPANYTDTNPDDLASLSLFRDQEEVRIPKIEEGKEILLAAYFYDSDDLFGEEFAKIESKPESAFAQTELGYTLTIEFSK